MITIHRSAHHLGCQFFCRSRLPWWLIHFNQPQHKLTRLRVILFCSAARKKPRTDYTYSRSLSYTAVSPERVGPPSMSRLSLHSPGHGAGDSPVLGSRRVTAGAGRTGRGRRTGGVEDGSERTALEGGQKQGEGWCVGSWYAVRNRICFGDIYRSTPRNAFLPFGGQSVFCLWTGCILWRIL